MQQKQISKADMKKKIEAWQIMYQVALSGQNEFMKRLQGILTEKETNRVALQEKLEKNEGSSDENAEYLFLSGYTQCLKDILKKAE